MSLQTLLDIVATFHSPAFVDEPTACDAFVAARWPSGVIPCPSCGAACDRRLAQLRCRGPSRHRPTILYGTPLGTKLRPNVRATLLALRAMAMTRRSVSATELATAVGMNRVTLWRHMQSLRAVLPAYPPERRDPITRQTLRTWVNGTFHGVHPPWRHRYEQEYLAGRLLGRALLVGALAKFVIGHDAFTLKMARARIYPEQPMRWFKPVCSE